MKLNCPSEFYLLKQNYDIVDKLFELFGDTDRNFRIDKIKDGCFPAVLTINGFHTQGKHNHSEWRESIETLYPKNIWFQVDWDSQTPLNWLGHLNVMALANSPWHKASRNSDAAAQRLFQVLLSCSLENEYILIGHSLGAKLIFHTLVQNANAAQKLNIREVHLLGGAVENNSAIWTKAASGVSRIIYNYSSQNDDVLSFLYRGAEQKIPIGISRIESRMVYNYDATDVVKDHFSYLKNFSQFHI